MGKGNHDVRTILSCFFFFRLLIPPDDLRDLTRRVGRGEDGELSEEKAIEGVEREVGVSDISDFREASLLPSTSSKAQILTRYPLIIVEVRLNL